jgi:hypothetical protein
VADTQKALPPKEEAVPTTTAELKALLKRSQSGDHTALPVVRKLLDDPYYLRLFGGELAENAANSFLRAMSEKDIGFAEAARKKMELMRAELLGANPTPVERLLVERIVACWLQVQDADIRAAQGQKDATLRWADFHQRRMDAANKRFLSAVKALALVRKLAVPALQINIAKKQVNVVAPAAVTPKTD